MKTNYKSYEVPEYVYWNAEENVPFYDIDRRAWWIKRKFPDWELITDEEYYEFEGKHDPNGGYLGECKLRSDGYDPQLTAIAAGYIPKGTFVNHVMAPSYAGVAIHAEKLLNPDTGAVYLNTDTGILSVYNGSEWIELDSGGNLVVPSCNNDDHIIDNLGRDSSFATMHGGN